ncbi:MAG: GAF domain-containing protein [Chloroflexota bacterium]
MPTHDDPDASLRAQLRHLLQALEAAGRAVPPGSADALLESIVEGAARIFGAAAASIALVDEPTRTLHFVVAYGAGRDAVVGQRIPLGQGIAGYVAMSGQPLAISDVQRDPRFAQGFASATGYVPRSILAMPLLSGERIIGVMEVLDKIAAPSFGLRDMELLGLFARQAAIAIDQARGMARLTDALVLGLQRRLAETTDPSASVALGELARLVERDPGDDLCADDLLALADLFGTLADLGAEERQLALRVLHVVAEYARARALAAGPALGR